MVFAMKKLLLSCLTVSLLAACESGPAGDTNTDKTDVKMETTANGITPMASASLDMSSALTRIAFGSCLGELDEQSIWTTIQAENPDLFLFIGDNVYGDPRKYDPDYGDPTMAKMIKSYNTLASVPEFTAFRKDIPLMTTWDDHDYGENDGGADFPFKALAEQLYLDAWNVPADDVRRLREGIYNAYMVGPEGQRVQIILLDTRTFRGELTETDEKYAAGKELYLPNPDPSQTMLGNVQWAWFEHELTKEADLRILVTSIQLHADGHGWEAWRTLPNEQQKFYDLLEDNNINNAVVISGDRHSGALYKRKGIWELTSSSLNKPASVWRAQRGQTEHEAGPYRIGIPQYEVNYGLLDIDWEKREVSMTLRSPGNDDVIQAVRF